MHEQRIYHSFYKYTFNFNPDDEILFETSHTNS